ncbi:MAG: hypothetical protein Q9227_003164 [Pyrenula ochraceoflavens]
MKASVYAVAAANLAAMVSAHGMLTSPKPRQAGPAMAAACGEQMVSQQTSDSYGNIQGELQTTTGGQGGYDAAKCNIWTCKGYKYEDNTDNVQHYSVGQVVPMTFDIRAPHDGVANVSIVTSDGQTVSQPMASWTNFASNAVPISSMPNQTSFSVTIPDVGDKCSTAGACVIQHYWNAASIDQTYESCIDVVIGGSGSGSGTNTTSPSNSSSSAISSNSTPVASSSSTSSLVLTGTGSSSSPTISNPSLPVATGGSGASSSSSKKPCKSKPSSSSGASSTTLSTVTLPTPSAPTVPAMPGSSGSAGSGSGTGAGAGPSGSTGDSSMEELVNLIMQLIQSLLGDENSNA